MADRRTFREIVFGQTNVEDQRTTKRINFFRDDPVMPSSFTQGYNTSAGEFNLKDLGNGQSNSAVTACLQVLGVSFSEANLIIKSIDKEGVETTIPNHPMELLMQRPNPYMSGDVVQQYIMNAMHVFGDAYLLKQRNAVGQVVALYPLIPDNVTPKGTPETLITHYVYEMENDEVKIAPEEIIHFRMGLNPKDHKKGYSPLLTVLREVFGDESAGQLATALLSNMGVPSVMITPKNDFGITDDEGVQIAKTYQQKVGGSKRGQPLVLSGDMNIEKLSFSPSELDIGTLRRIPEERVSAVLGVPAILAGLGAGLAQATYSNAKVLREYFTENKLIPMWRMIGAELTHQLLVPDYESNAITKAEYDFSEVRALQGDEKELYEKINVAVKGGWMSVNEAREKVGLPVDETEDVYYVPNNATPVEKGEISVTEISTEFEEETIDSDDDIEEQNDNAFQEAGRTLDIVVVKENDQYVVYDDAGTKTYGTFPTEDLAEVRVNQILDGDETHTESLDIKEEVSKDNFTTNEEALARAEELGCNGTHTHDDNGNLIYMPCSTHQEYELALAESDEATN
tara:strand:- start:9042 stop:10751 length:1710 start_codon:yes stop_codon:yes gene_type:complete